jgi:hypothetical protein
MGSVSKRGDKWHYAFDIAKVNGKRQRIQRVGGRVKREAEIKLSKAIELYNNANLILDETGLSISDYVNYWYEDCVEDNKRR